MRHALGTLGRYGGYPAVVLLALGVTALTQAAGLAYGPSVAIVTVLVGAVVLAGELLWPMRRSWTLTREDLEADALHGLVSSGVPATILEMTLKAALLQGALWLRADRGIDLWPDSAPLWAQVLLALFAAEVGFYTVHRLFHESGKDWLWAWHAVHHSSTRMYFLAGSRTHPIQVLVSFGATVAILWALGVPDEVVFYKTVLHATNGILQHANLDLRLGWLNYVIAGPELHRWHHSEVISEGNHNYGNNLALLDVVLGTRFLPGPGTAPERVGLGPEVPLTNSFAGHLALPFRMLGSAAAPSGGEASREPAAALRPADDEGIV